MADFVKEVVGKTVATMEDNEKMRFLSQEAKVVINMTINAARRELKLDNGRTADRQEVIEAARWALDQGGQNIANRKIMSMLTGAYRNYEFLSQRQWPTCAACDDFLPYTTLIGTVYATLCNNCKK